MDNKNIVKKDLLRRKIKEYFSKNPTAKSVIIHSGTGNLKSTWRVVKEKNSFSVTEVNTQKEQFIIKEDDDKEKDKSKSFKSPQKTSVTGDPRSSYKPSGVVRPIGPAGTVAPGDEVPYNQQQFAKSFDKPVSPAITPQQAMGQWDPNKEGGAFQRLKKTVGLRKAMLGMPDSELKKYFGIGKKSLMRQRQDAVGKQRAKAAGLKPYGNPYGEGLQEASVEYTNLSKQFVQAMSPPFDHVKLSNALKSANVAISKVSDPKERSEMGAMIGALTSIVDATTAGGGSPLGQRSSSTVKKTLTTSRKVSGKVLKEADPKKKDKSIETLPADEVDSDPVEDIPVDSQETAVDVPLKQVSGEELAVQKALAGQTIRDANIEITPSGAELTLTLINSTLPAKFIWSKDGKVVFQYNGRPYTIKRD